MIYDCFLYYDEDMLLDIRLNTLSAVVDRFVIVESTHTFTGLPKPLNFDSKKFDAFKDKIIYIIYDEKPIFKEDGHVDAWVNEERTRNAIMRGLKSASDSDLVIISDIDEIPSPDSILKVDSSRLCTTMIMNFYNYQFNLQVFNADGQPRLWELSRATSFKNLKGFFEGNPETLRNIKKSKIKNNFLKWNAFKFFNKKLPNAGWHFSWIMTPDRISEKMNSISHTEYNLPQFNNKAHIIDALEKGKDIWGRERIMRKTALDEHFPDYLVKNRERFREFIL
ncbi:glycosyltransferase family 17 protein [Enterobacter cloacae]|jgi:beta-1,4-mannosyl-glycoprotein beta-1,4-N-acetylglucosaminyltransferase|uniref:benzoate transporter n=1 Tax=Enterobacter cloacae TaxID=550 RepID=UPI0017885B77|nr:benzoate transporter [Enterobacter cloacae]MBE1252578.1 benzoate transporter [Enterobacter cloacae]MBG0521450.1 benzoate transporter [Enterobacter cloacae]HDC4368925.1 benzoate transporter [Enterobacter cloacae]